MAVLNPNENPEDRAQSQSSNHRASQRQIKERSSVNQSLSSDLISTQQPFVQKQRKRHDQSQVKH